MQSSTAQATILIYMALNKLKGGSTRRPPILMPRKKNMTVPDLQAVVMEVYKATPGQYKNQIIMTALYEEFLCQENFKNFVLDSYARLPMQNGVTLECIPEDVRLHAGILIGHYLSVHVFGELHTLEMMRLDMLAYLYMCRNLIALVVDDQWKTNPPAVFDTGLYSYFNGLCYEARVSPLRNFSMMVHRLNMSEEAAQNIHSALLNAQYLSPSINPRKIM